MVWDMNVRNCRKCKRLFNYMVGPVLCEACKQGLEVKFQEVKKYIQDNPRSDIRMVSEACEVDPAQIRQWIREERLCFTDDSPIGIACERCGTTIRTGRFCEHCKNDMANSFNKAITPQGTVVQSKEEDRRTSNKMRFLNN